MHKISDVKIEQDMMNINNRIATENKAAFDANNVTVFNVMGAIGSGKTCLIEYAIEQLKDTYTVAAIAGDVVAKFDSDRFASHNAISIPISTGKECHLDAHLVSHALADVNLSSIDVLFIENVGNLICPADFDLGEHMKIVIVSVSEGDDIVLKHPVIFKNADLTVVNKSDIAEFVGASTEKMVKDAKTCGCRNVISTSCKKDIGLDEWIRIIVEQIQKDKC